MLVAQFCPNLCDPIDCSPPGSSVHGILQARILEWVAISFCRGSSLPRNWAQVSCIAGRFFTIWATREAHRQVTRHKRGQGALYPRFFTGVCPPSLWKTCPHLVAGHTTPQNPACWGKPKQHAEHTQPKCHDSAFVFAWNCLCQNPNTFVFKDFFFFNVDHF